MEPARPRPCPRPWTLTDWRTPSFWHQCQGPTQLGTHGREAPRPDAGVCIAGPDDTAGGDRVNLTREGSLMPVPSLCLLLHGRVDQVQRVDIQWQNSIALLFSRIRAYVTRTDSHLAALTFRRETTTNPFFSSPFLTEVQLFF